MVVDDPFQEGEAQHSTRREAPPSLSPILRARSTTDLQGVLQSSAPPSRTPEDELATAAAQGPTIPIPGVRTPRRVQWTNDHIINLQPERASPDQQVTESNIENVNDALEQFKTRRYRPSQLSMASAPSSEANSEDERDITESEQQRRQHHHHHPHSHVHHHPSVQRHTYPPRHEGPESEEDYDYRLDTDPDPNPEDKEDKDEDKEERDDGGFEQNLLDTGVNDHVRGAYIPSGETDGLPNIPSDSQQQETPADRAADLVRQHTSRWSNLRRRVRSGSVKKSRHHGHGHGGGNGGDSDWDEKGRTSEELAHATPHTPLNPPPGSGLPHIPGGASVLGTLLALYGQQQSNSGNTSGSNTAVTTPVSSRPPSVISTDDEQDKYEQSGQTPQRKKSLWSKKETVPAAEIEEPRSSSAFDESKRQRSSTSIADRESPAYTPGVRGMFQRAAHTWKESDRPKAARSDAGVFGALVQNAGGMAAAAAPAASTLIPAAKRPGYHLSRYSLDSAHLGGPPRRSMADDSRPGSVYSATLNDHSPDRDEKGGDASTDNLIMMKKKPAKSSDDLQSLKTKPLKSSDDLQALKKDNRKSSMLNLRSLEKGGTAALRSAENWMLPKSRPHTPPEKLTEDERKRREWEAEKRRRKKEHAKRKKQEMYIIKHVAAIITRQHFIMKLARCLMMFGSPSHRLETQIQATARVLDINAQVVYIPGTILVSFGDDATHTSETKFLKQATGLDLGKLLRVHNVYWDVVHDKISVEEANKDLDKLMTMPPCYNLWQTILVGMLCSSFIVVPSFHGSFIDALMAAPLGGLLIVIQVIAAKNDMFSNVFEIAVATLISFLAAVLASTNYFCFTALVSGGVVLILPGYIVLTGALELAARNITAGAVRMGYSVIYSLFLGFGVSIGAEIYTKIRNKGVQNVNDWRCAGTHYEGAPWYMSEPSQFWYFLCVPAYALSLSLRNQQPLFAKELIVMIAVACAGWVVNFFSAKAFEGRSDIVSALGAFTVGLLGNLYGRFLSNGASFPVMVVGILMQLPSGLANGGIFNFAAQGQTKDAQGQDVTTDSQEQWSSGFSVAQQLVSVAIGLTVGLFVAAVVTHPLGGSRRRGAGIFSF